MFEIIALIFIAKYIGKVAVQKGLKPGKWKLYTILCWFGFEIIGIALGLFFFNNRDLFSLQFLGFIFASGGFLVIRSVLLSKPDIEDHNDIDSIGTEDLYPGKNKS